MCKDLAQKRKVKKLNTFVANLPEFCPNFLKRPVPPRLLQKVWDFFVMMIMTLQQVSAGFFQVLASLYFTFDWEVVYGLYMLSFPLQPGWVSPLGASNQHKRQRNTRNTTEIGDKQCKSNLGLKL